MIICDKGKILVNGKPELVWSEATVTVAHIISLTYEQFKDVEMIKGLVNYFISNVLEEFEEENGVKLNFEDDDGEEEHDEQSILDEFTLTTLTGEKLKEFLEGKGMMF